MSTPEGPRADAQVTVVDVAAEVSEFCSGYGSYSDLGDEAKAMFGEYARTHPSEVEGWRAEEPDMPTYDADEASI